MPRSPSPKRDPDSHEMKRQQSKAAKLAKKAMKEEAAAQKRAIESEKKLATYALVDVIVGMKWNNPTLRYRQEKKLPDGFLSSKKTKQLVWSDVHCPVQETVAAILDRKNEGPGKPMKRKDALCAKPEDEEKDPILDTKVHPIVPNVFASVGLPGEYPPMLPIAALGAAITVGDRSAWTLGAMTLASMVTAMQLNNPDSHGKSLAGLKKSRQEVAFDAAKEYLLKAIDNIGKLNVEDDDDNADGDDSDNDDDKVDDIHPTWFNAKAKAATEMTIMILRAVCPEAMETIAMLSTAQGFKKWADKKKLQYAEEGDEYYGSINNAHDRIADAFGKMTKKNPAWEGLTMVRHDLAMVKGTSSGEVWMFKSGRLPEPGLQKVYLPVLKKATIVTDGTEEVLATTEVFQDRKDLTKFYEWDKMGQEY